MLRAAVERNLEVVGEAIVQGKHHFPDQIIQIQDHVKVVSFRNELAHGYNGLDHHEVWTVIQVALPLLLQQVAILLQQTPPKAKG